jgi:hypothetical protein
MPRSASHPGKWTDNPDTEMTESLMAWGMGFGS